MLTATRQIVAEGGTDVLVLTSFSDADRIVAALDAGAVGYLLKDADPDDVIEGVRAVSRGGVAHPPAGGPPAAGGAGRDAERGRTSPRASSRSSRW